MKVCEIQSLQVDSSRITKLFSKNLNVFKRKSYVLVLTQKQSQNNLMSKYFDGWGRIWRWTIFEHNTSWKLEILYLGSSSVSDLLQWEDKNVALSQSSLTDTTHFRKWSGCETKLECHWSIFFVGLQTRRIGCHASSLPNLILNGIAISNKRLWRTSQARLWQIHTAANSCVLVV